jgi:hypothetical protein
MYTLKLSFDRPDQISAGPCVFEDLVEKQNKTTLFKVTEPSSVPYRCHGSCNKYVLSRSYTAQGVSDSACSQAIPLQGDGCQTGSIECVLYRMCSSSCTCGACLMVRQAHTPMRFDILY